MLSERGETERIETRQNGRRKKSEIISRSKQCRELL